VSILSLLDGLAGVVRRVQQLCTLFLAIPFHHSEQVLLHVSLNGNWIKAQYFRKKAEGKG